MRAGGSLFGGKFIEQASEEEEKNKGEEKGVNIPSTSLNLSSLRSTSMRPICSPRPAGVALTPRTAVVIAQDTDFSIAGPLLRSPRVDFTTPRPIPIGTGSASSSPVTGSPLSSSYDGRGSLAKTVVAPNPPSSEPVLVATTPRLLLQGDEGL